MTRRTARCPAPDCGFSDVPSLVAAHVNGTEGPEHDWARLPYDGPGEFLATVREGDGEGPPEARNDPQAATVDPDETDGDPADAAVDPDETDEDLADAAVDPDEATAAHRIDPEPVFRAVDIVRERVADVEDLDALDVAELADLFVAFSVLASEAGTVRSDVRAAIIDRIDEEREIDGELGSVGRSMSTRRSLRNESTVRKALFHAGIDPRDAESFDPDLLAELIDDADVGVEEDDVFETSESDHVRRTDVDETAFENR
ncbi:hypothetical protein [Halorubrum sp. DTA98]|uniref:hypothetical protein n=1 Tax=Halorubrum sp. DTA98 TaxID=3402163 RepID=UPI003AAABE87